jgi:hypothetical protein
MESWQRQVETIFVAIPMDELVRMILYLETG